MFDILILTDHSAKLKSNKPAGAYRIASALRHAGYKVFVLNIMSTFYEKGVLFDILDSLVSERTFMVGFSSTFFSRPGTNYTKTKDGLTLRIVHSHLSPWPLEPDDMQEVLDYFKEKNIKTVYGSFNEKRHNDIKNSVDYAVYGLGDHMVVELANHIKNGTPLFFNINYDGIAKVLDHDYTGAKFDFRNTHTWHEKYDFIDSREGLNMEFSRGCIFKCKFCSYPLLGKHKNDVSHLRCRESIKEEFRRNYEEYGVTRYNFVDDTFNESTEKLRDIAEVLEELDLKIEAWAYLRLDLMVAFPEQIELLKRIGLKYWFLGIETLNHESGKAVGKGLHPDKVRETLKMIQREYPGEFHIHGNFIIGLPHDTPENTMEWLNWVYDPDFPLDSIYCGALVFFPNGRSHLDTHHKDYGYTIDSNYFWKNDHWNQEDAIKFVHDFHEDVKEKTNVLVGSQMAPALCNIGVGYDEVMKIIRHPDGEQIADSLAQPIVDDYIQNVINFAIELHSNK